MRLKLDLKQIKAQVLKQQGDWIKVGMSTCGIAAGAQEVLDVLLQEKQKRNLDIRIEQCGCAGKCFAEPLVEVSVRGMPRVVYGKVDKDTAVKIIDKHALGKFLINDHIYEVKAE